MIFSECPLYGLKSKKMLRRLLHIDSSKLFRQEYVASLVSPYIDRKGKPRLIEPPAAELKNIQKQIKIMLGQISIPGNIFSGVKGRSYVENAALHTGSKCRMLFKIDLTAFFPTIRRETVYRFFNTDLCCAPDISEILTNFTTIDIEKSKAENLEDIYDFLDQKGISCKNHLISGSPTSQIMSYLVNHAMFDEMQAIANENNTTMSVYVDDVTFSSEFRISHQFMEKIYSIVHKYGYKLSKPKVKRYTKLYPKLITGVIVGSSGQLKVKNSMSLKIIKEFEYLQIHPDDCESKLRLQGLLTAARQVDPRIFPSIYEFVHHSS